MRSSCQFRNRAARTAGKRWLIPWKICKFRQSANAENQKTWSKDYRRGLHNGLADAQSDLFFFLLLTSTIFVSSKNLK
jgi:hypothetical protein